MRSLLRFMNAASLVHLVLTDVVKIDRNNIDAIANESSVFIKFFSPSCSYCQRLAPQWDRVGTEAALRPEGFLVGK